MGSGGSCLVISWSFCIAGPLVSKVTDLPIFGTSFLIVLCGSFGGSVMLGLLRILSVLFRGWNNYFLPAYLNGLMPRVIITLFLFMKCSALAVSLCNGPVVHTLCTRVVFINEIITYQKKRRKKKNHFHTRNVRVLRKVCVMAYVFSIASLSRKFLLYVTQSGCLESCSKECLIFFLIFFIFFSYPKCWPYFYFF